MSNIGRIIDSNYQRLYAKKLEYQMKCEYYEYNIIKFKIHCFYALQAEHISLTFFLYGLKDAHNITVGHMVKEITHFDQSLHNKIEYAIRHKLNLENKIFWRNQNIDIEEIKRWIKF